MSVKSAIFINFVGLHSVCTNNMLSYIYLYSTLALSGGGGVIRLYISF